MRTQRALAVFVWSYPETVLHAYAKWKRRVLAFFPIQIVREKERTRQGNERENAETRSLPSAWWHEWRPIPWKIVQCACQTTMCMYVCRTASNCCCMICFYFSNEEMLFRCWLFLDGTGSCDSNVLWTWHALLSLSDHSYFILKFQKSSELFKLKSVHFQVNWNWKLHKNTKKRKKKLCFPTISR